MWIHRQTNLYSCYLMNCKDSHRSPFGLFGMLRCGRRPEHPLGMIHPFLSRKQLYRRHQRQLITVGCGYLHSWCHQSRRNRQLPVNHYTLGFLNHRIQHSSCNPLVYNPITTWWSQKPNHQVNHHRFAFLSPKPNHHQVTSTQWPLP
jgi:hypothetical protein